MENNFEYNNQFEQKEGKYELPEENLVALDENSEIRQKNQEHYKVLKEKGFEWPVEIQGSGLTDPEKGEFFVYYPKGDKFISWAVTIHELGHLRQAERYSGKKLEELDQSNIVLEENAWDAGWNKIREYCPDVVKELDEEFAQNKEKGKLNDFNSFSEYFDYIKKMCLKVSEAVKDFPEETSKKEYGEMLAKEIEKDPELKEFLSEQDKWRLGEIVDQERIEDFIKTMASRIAEE